MKSAIFNVEEYEAFYGPIETIDCEKEERKRIVRYYKERKLIMNYRKYLHRQKVLALLSILFSVFCCFLSSIATEIYLIAFVFLLIGVPMLITDKVVIY